MRSCAKFLPALGFISLIAVAGPVHGHYREFPFALGAAGNPGTGAKPALGQFELNLEHHLAQMEPVLKRYGYPAIFLTIFVEGVGLLAPGQTLLVVGAIAAARGEFNIVWVLACAIAAAVLGNSLGYLLGRWCGRPLFGKLKVSEKHLRRMEGYFSRHGKWVVLIARFVDGLRQLNGVVAGMMKMPWRVFTVFNILGAVLWTGIWGLGAYFFEKDIAAMNLAMRRIYPWAVSLSLLIFLALMVYLLRDRRTRETHQ